jgi:hypothetical protein
VNKKPMQNCITIIKRERRRKIFENLNRKREGKNAVNSGHYVLLLCSDQ